MSKIKYPKLIVLMISFFLAYLIFLEKDFQPLHRFLLSLGYLGNFIAGLFYAYGFTAAPATAVLLTIAKQGNLLIAALLGGLGALVGDLIIFFFLRYTFNKELNRLSKEKIVKKIIKEEKKLLGPYQKYFLATFAGFIIASPLPTEVGVMLMSSLKELSVKKFTIIAYILHTLGILIILGIGNLV